MIKVVTIVMLLFFVTPVFAQRKKKKGKEEELKTEALSDLSALRSEKQFPAVELFHQAVREKLAGNLKEAKKLFTECLEQYPYPDAVHFGLAEIAQKRQLKSEALTHYLDAQKADPSNIYFTSQIAFLQFEKADFEDAVKNFAILVEHEPRNVEWIYAYGQSLVYMRDYKTAILQFDRVTDQMGLIPDIVMLKVELHKELKQFDQAEAALIELKKAHPQDLEVLKTLIGFYEEQGKNAKAISLIKELVKADPENAVANYILAKEFLEKGELSAYLSSLNVVVKSEMLEEDDKIQLMQPMFEFPEDYDDELLTVTQSFADAHPTSAKALAIHAETLKSVGNITEALAYYRKALKENTAEYRLWTSVLAFQSGHRMYEALYEDAQKAMELFPSLPYVYFCAAEGALYLGKYDDATDFLDAGEMYVLDDEAYQARYSMRRAEIFAVQGKNNEASRLFEEALKKEPSSPLIELTFAYHLANSNTDLKRATKIAETYLEDTDYYIKAHYVIVTVLARKNKHDEIIELLSKNGLNKPPFAADLYDLLGDAYLYTGHIEEALGAWNTALKRGSRNTKLPIKIKEKKYYAPEYR